MRTCGSLFQIQRIGAVIVEVKEKPSGGGKRRPEDESGLGAL